MLKNRFLLNKINFMNIFKSFVINIKNGFLNLIYPKHIKCIFCGEEIELNNSFDSCENCINTLPIINTDYCYRCGGKREKDAVGVCLNCKINNFDFDFARSVFEYNDKLIPTIHKLKFGGGKYLVKPLSFYLYSKLKTLDWKIDLITFVPMYTKRQKERGYNQAEELAKELSKLINIKCEPMFTKIKDTKEQAKLSGKERRTNLKDSFKLIYKDIAGKNILIVDDVYTTGATSNELARLIKDKSNNIYILTLAHSKIDETNV